MNRSILIVICDFLLVSLLAFSTVDINQATDHAPQPQLTLERGTNRVDSGQDLAAVMRLALDEERQKRNALLSELSQARTTASEREKQANTVQQQLEAKGQEASQLQQQQAQLLQQFAAAQTNLVALNQQLQSRSNQATISEEKLAAREEELRRQNEQAEALRRQLAQLAKSNQVAQAEKQQLAGQLQVAEVEKRSAVEQVGRMQELVKVEREEKARLSAQTEKLAEGVKALATNSSQLAQEVRESRPLAANTIFNDFVTNRVEAQFVANRAGFFGNDATRRKDTQTILVTNGTNIFALCHVQETPFVFGNPGIEWEGLTGTLVGNILMVPIHSVGFSQSDPRLVLMPVSPVEVRRLGCKVYRISSEPFKFQDAVVVGAREGYYGECRFEVDVTTPDYVKLDRNVLKGLFGKFNPSRGDLVFTRTGELLGVMANADYCSLLRNVTPSTTIRFEPDVRDQHTGQTLARLYAMLTELPFKLQ
jgi:hypothetical protein